MLDPDYQPPTTIPEALDEALSRIASEKTLENIERIIGRGNAMRITITFDRQEAGGLRVVTHCEERTKPWTIYYSKNLSL